MTARTVDDIAGLIRELDPDNTMGAWRQGLRLGERMDAAGMLVGLCPINDIAAFVENINRYKSYNPDSLAVALVRHFSLVQEVTR